MIAAGFLAQLAGQAEAAAQQGAAQVADALAVRVAVELPGVQAEATGTAVTLTAPGLRARAFGSRRRAADPRLSGLLTVLKGGRR